MSGAYGAYELFFLSDQPNRGRIVSYRRQMSWLTPHSDEDPLDMRVSPTNTS